MHELSLAEEMLQMIAGVIGSGSRLERVNIVIGPLSGVSADSLRFCFTELAAMRGFGSPDLVVDETAASIRCRSCGLSYEVHEFTEGCPVCGSLERDILSGMECTLESIEVDDGGRPAERTDS
jgi:hydrogenase nickel incorporation protein HypA/HybF